MIVKKDLIKYLADYIEQEYSEHVPCAPVVFDVYDLRYWISEGLDAFESVHETIITFWSQKSES